MTEEMHSPGIKPDLAVWMVNYKSAALVAKSLASLSRVDISEILLWDNASGIEEQSALRALAEQDSRIRLFESQVNLGFGSAMNELADRSSSRPSDLVWILNPDTELLAGSVDVLREALQSQQIDIVSPLIVCGNLDKPVVWYNGGGVDTRTGRCWHDDYAQENWSVQPRVHPTTFVTGAAPMMTKFVWDRIGGFHDGLFLYWEDVEFSLRAADLGIKMGVHGGCVVWHLEGGSGSTVTGHSVVYYFNTARNRVRVCGSRSSSVGVAIGSGLRETVASVLRPILREESGRLVKAFAAFRGTVNGLIGKDRALGARRQRRPDLAIDRRPNIEDHKEGAA